jgi:diacylglycerol kinase family enzyme
MKRWLGHPLFIYAALRTWLVNYDRKEPHFIVECEGHEPSPGYFTIVLNTNPYTYLGNRPLDLSPAATLDRGLVVITFTSMKVSAILGGLGGALRGGGVTASTTLDLQTDVSELTISADDGFPYQLDGDYLGETKQLEFSHVPNAVRLVRPQTP